MKMDLNEFVEIETNLFKAKLKSVLKANINKKNKIDYDKFWAEQLKEFKLKLNEVDKTNGTQ